MRRFLRLYEVRHRVPYGKASIYRLMAQGDFPRPHSMGARAVAWLESDIDAWIESRVRNASQDTAQSAAETAARPRKSRRQRKPQRQAGAVRLSHAAGNADDDDIPF